MDDDQLEKTNDGRLVTNVYAENKTFEEHEMDSKQSTISLESFDDSNKKIQGNHPGIHTPKTMAKRKTVVRVTTKAQ